MLNKIIQSIYLQTSIYDKFDLFSLLSTSSTNFKFCGYHFVNQTCQVFCRHMLLDHQSVCKEHGHTIILKHSSDKDSVLRLIFFFSVLQLLGVEITYEGVERNLGVKNRRNYAKIVVVNRSEYCKIYCNWCRVVAVRWVRST